MSREAQPSRSPEDMASSRTSPSAAVCSPEPPAHRSSTLNEAEKRQGLLPVAANMSRDELIVELEHQRRNVVLLQGEVRRLRAAAAHVAVKSEADEEAFANKLLKLQRDDRRAHAGAGHPASTPTNTQKSARLERQLQQVWFPANVRNRAPQLTPRPTVRVSHEPESVATRQG